MSDLRELYQEVILDHNRRPRNFRAIQAANRHAEGYNPLCGDRLSLYLTLWGIGLLAHGQKETLAVGEGVL